MCCCLFGGGGTNLGDVLGAVGPMTTSVELTLVALVLQLLAVFDAVTLSSTVETLVVLWQWVSFSLALLLLIPGEGADVFLVSGSHSYLHCFHLVERFARSGFLPCLCVHSIRFQVGTNFFYGHKHSVIVL